MNPIEQIEKYKDKIISAVIIIVALVTAANIYKGGQANIKSLEVKISEEEKKNSEIEKIIRMEKKIASFKELLPRKEASLVMADISNIAKQAKVRVLTVRPDREELGADYIKDIFEVVVNAASYDDLGNFINTLETSANVYAVDGIDISVQSKGEKEELAVSLRISSVSAK